MAHDDWPYPDPPTDRERKRLQTRAEDLFTDEERKAMKQDRGEQILANGGRAGARRPCKCKKPRPHQRWSWTCAKCGGVIKKKGDAVD